MNDGSTPTVNDEIGASDNRLEIDPTDDKFAVVKDWQDGQTYRGVQVDLQQVSPGQFRVLAMSGGTPEGQATDESEPTEETAPGAEAAETGGSMNPAVAKMMAAEKY